MTYQIQWLQFRKNSIKIFIPQSCFLWQMFLPPKQKKKRSVCMNQNHTKGFFSFYIKHSYIEYIYVSCIYVHVLVISIIFCPMIVLHMGWNFLLICKLTDSFPNKMSTNGNVFSMGSLKNWQRKGADRFIVNTLPDSWACLAILNTEEGLTVRGKLCWKKRERYMILVGMKTWHCWEINMLVPVFKQA